MDRLGSVRREAVTACLAGINTPAQESALKNALGVIDSLPAVAGREADRRIRAGDQEVTVTLDYELSELEKDIQFLEKGDPALADYHAGRQQDFRREVSELAAFLGGRTFGVFLTDRDGTVNNYCGRYRSSHQSVYNAVYLTRFVRARARRSVILTSAPLDDGGLLALTAMPEGAVCYAGSTGREYQAENGERGALEMSEEEEQHLAELNRRLAELLRREENHVFSVIGSGVQYKYGQTTVSHQDIHGSVAQEKSVDFVETVKEMVRSVDPRGQFFRISDTGKDLEIMLTVNGDRDFHKGDGAAYLDRALGLEMSGHECLVCGDTASDVAMAEYAVRKAGTDRTRVVFVTREQSLRRQVADIAPQSHFVSSPDVLVTALNDLSKEQHA